ncbi:hypothetical protein TOK_1432 [Pseudonocardia sp. N23]|nr:hypothetical protein TOK_1432 [Pseudonocardia sp. N23]
MALAGLLSAVLTLVVAGSAAGASCDDGCARLGPVSSPAPATPTPHTADPHPAPAAPAAPLPARIAGAVGP